MGSGPSKEAPGEFSIKALKAFAADPRTAMIAGRNRHGAIFSTGSSLIQKVVGLVGPEALQQFEENVENGNLGRKGAFPPGLQEMVGNIMPTTDNPEHAINKKAIVQVLTPEYIKSYIPVLRSVLEREIACLLEKKGAEFSWVQASDRIMFAAAIAVILGVTEDIDKVKADLDIWAKMFETSALKAEKKGLQAKTRLQAFIHTVVVEAKKRVEEGKQKVCVLDNILLLKALPESHLEIECWHMVIAGCALIPLAAICTLHACVLDAKLWKQAVEEMTRLADETKDPWNNVGAQTMPFITSLLLEVKRFYVLGPTTVPAVVKKNFVIKTKEGNFDVPKGALCIAGLEATCKSPSTWENPDTFNPSRFKDFNLEDKDNRFRFCPQSFGTVRRCAGEDLTTTFMQCFVLSLAPYEWKMTQGQDYTFESNSMAPKPLGGLMAHEFAVRSPKVDTQPPASNEPTQNLSSQQPEADDAPPAAEA